MSQLCPAFEDTCSCREWRGAAEYWLGDMQRAIQGSGAATPEHAVHAAVHGAPLEGVRQLLATRQASSCSSTALASCTQPAVVSTVSCRANVVALMQDIMLPHTYIKNINLHSRHKQAMHHC